MPLVTCPCAFRLRRLAQNASRRIIIISIINIIINKNIIIIIINIINTQPFYSLHTVWGLLPG
jgi:hypothetical protein